MNYKKSITAALIALGFISAASAAPIEIHITGSTAFRATFFSAAVPGGIFDPATTVTVQPAGANNGSGTITYLGKISGVDYALECSWTGSEAGIANVDGVGTLSNPGLPNSWHGAGNLPGATTTFPKTDGTTGAGAFTGAGDIALADTSQAVSLTKPPAHPALHDYGVAGIVTFTWVKGLNSTPNSGDDGDTAWKRLTNVSHQNMSVLLGGSLPASYLTGNAADVNTSVFLVGRNAGSGTRANTLLDTGYGIGTSVSQLALNSTYAGANGDVLTYKVVANNQAATYPTVAASLANFTDATTTPNFLGVGNDGYESGGGVSQCLSCDLTGSEIITVGYAGISDAKACRDGKAASGTTPAQPGGAVFLSLDGLQYDDAQVANGAYTFWGHEHVFAKTQNTDNDRVAAHILSGIASQGGLGNGTAGVQSAGIFAASMNVDRPGGGDSGIPTP